jgi:hypothetical protein
VLRFQNVYGEGNSLKNPDTGTPVDLFDANPAWAVVADLRGR